jgi:hypothetical protein
MARGGAGLLEPGFPIGHLAVSGAAGNVRFRTAAGWGPWQPVVAGCTGRTDRAAALLPAGGALGVELDPGPGVDVTTLAINTTDGPRRTAARRAVPTDPPPGVQDRVRYRSRAGWEADESLRFGPDGTELFPTAFFPVQTFTVHHTVTANADPTPAATVRAIYVAHTVAQGFGDIGYHLLVDQQGGVYEGRWSGADPIPVFGPRGGRPLMCNAAHVGGFNAGAVRHRDNAERAPRAVGLCRTAPSGNVGVALLGDLTSTQPTPAARETLVGLLAGLCALTRVDPHFDPARGGRPARSAGWTRRGRIGHSVHYVNPISGATRDVDAIAGHRDWLATECPGNAFAPTLPDLRREVAALLRPGVPRP